MDQQNHDEDLFDAAAAAAHLLEVPPLVNNNNDNHNNNVDDEVEIVEDAAALVGGNIVVNPDGSFDGGVAHSDSNNNNERGIDPPGHSQRAASECDLMLYFECDESFHNLVPMHAILRPGVIVAIGLDKSTRLNAVFRRYVEFCNEHPGVVISAEARKNATAAAAYQIDLSDLEFVHCQLLKGDDTAESAALMKNDKIRVRQNRDDERKETARQFRLQRDSDREYFKQLRQLLPDMGLSSTCSDLILDCRGKVVDKSGLSQEVLISTVRAHSAILAARCKWLGHFIQMARDEQRARQSVVTIPEPPEEALATAASDSRVVMDSNDHLRTVTSGNLQQVERREAASVVAIKSRSDDASMEDDEIGVLHLPMVMLMVGGGGRHHQHHPPPVQIMDQGGGATEIENDDDDDDVENDPFALNHHRVHDFEDGPSPFMASSSYGGAFGGSNGGGGNELWVTIPNHSPQAIRILLEYCYTNRVESLGEEAFLQASRISSSKSDGSNSNNHKNNKNSNVGPVPPAHWPKNGLPSVSFDVAMAGIALAEEAGLPRLSLMCEVAASELVEKVHHVVDALCLCTTQQQKTGNPLPRLRKAAMYMVLHARSKGVEELARTDSFRRALEQKSAALVPSLLSGTLDAVLSSGSNGNHHGSGSNSALGKRKRDSNNTNNSQGGDGSAVSDATTKFFLRVDFNDLKQRKIEREKRDRKKMKWAAADDDDDDDSDHSSGGGGGGGGDFYGEDADDDHLYRRHKARAEYLMDPSLKALLRGSGAGGGSSSRSGVAAAVKHFELAATLSRVTAARSARSAAAAAAAANTGASRRNGR